MMQTIFGPHRPAITAAFVLPPAMPHDEVSRADQQAQHQTGGGVLAARLDAERNADEGEGRRQAKEEA